MAVKPSSTSHNSAAPAAQIISHASTAALALEAEKRRKAELERQRQLSDGSTSDPSRDTHNTPVGPRRASPNGGSEMITRPSRDANHGFGPSVSVGSSSSSLRDTYGSFTHRQLAMNLGNGKGKLASVNA
jgi:hypothetical protein